MYLPFSTNVTNAVKKVDAREVIVKHNSGFAGSGSGGGGGTTQVRNVHMIPAGWWQNLFPLGGEQARGNKTYPAATGTNKYVWCVPFIPEFKG